MRRFTIRARFLLLLVGLLLAVFAAITFIIVRQNTHTLKDNLIGQSKSFAALATQPIGDAFVLYKDSGTLHIQQQVQRFTDLDSNINQVEIVDSMNHTLFTANSGHHINVSTDQAGSLDPAYLYDSSHNLTAIVQPYLENFGIHRYAIVYGISYQSVNHAIQNIVDFILAVSAVILLVSLVVWYVLINRLFLQPVAQLSHLALLISKGDLDKQISLDRKDEIGDLAQAVDTMASSLKADITKLKAVDKLKNEFMMITSHNLRTPLTIIKAHLERISGMNPPGEIKSLLDTIGVNALRLGGFAEDVLTISTIEGGKNILHKEPTDIGGLLKGVAEEFHGLAQQKKLRFTSDISTKAIVDLSPTQFRSALWNLLDNAYKFTAEGGEVKLLAHEQGGQVEIKVEDTGIGISAEELPQLFTKFHRATDTLQYDYEGTGIGLYIAKIIIEQHDGHIAAESIKGKGSTFRITLPISSSGAGKDAGAAGAEPQKDNLDMHADHDQGESQQQISDSVAAKEVAGTGMDDGDAVGNDALDENHHQDDQKDESDEP